MTDVVSNTSLRREKPWLLRRQDDSGNKFDVGSYDDRTEAEHERGKFEARGHKQTYSVERNPKA